MMSIPPNCSATASARAAQPSAVERSAATKCTPSGDTLGAERAVVITLDADVTQYGHDGGADAHCATRDKRTAVSEFEVEAHGMISSDAILSPSSRKKNRRSTGLPGKLPVRRLVIRVFPSFCSEEKG